MAENLSPYHGNLYHSEGPLIMRVKFQAGATKAIKRGEILELSSGNFIPLDADQSMAGIIAVADEEVKSGDLAGYFNVIVPRPGDVFEFELATAAAAAVGAALYWSTSQVVTTSAGSNVLGNVVDHDGVPGKQHHLSDGGLLDKGTTIVAASFVRMTIKAATSYYVALQT